MGLTVAACERDGRAAGALPALTGPVEIQRAAAWPTARMATLGFRLRTAVADTLRQVLVDGATDVSLHLSGPGGRGMTPVTEIPVTPGQELVFNEGGPHVMIMGLGQPLRVGDSVRVVFRFSRAGETSLMVPVLRYTEAVLQIGK
jgi:copper(I)-binding protein